MKLRNIFYSLVAAAFGLMAVSCNENEYEPTHLDGIEVSSSYVALPIGGGSVDVTLTAKSDWYVSYGSDTAPEWFTVTPETGSAGTYTLAFTAPAADATSSTTIYIVCGDETQNIDVLQMAEKVDLPISTCAEVNAGEDGTTYRVKGTVTTIANTTYGNMYITDETGTVYIYGTLDASGAEKNFSSLGIELGDIVTVEGPRSTYGTTVEMVNVTVIEIEKSLIKVDSTIVAGVDTTGIAKDGGDMVVYLTCKGEGVTVTIPDEAQSWLSVTGVTTGDNAATVTLHATANELGDHSTTVQFVTTSGGKEYLASTEVTQAGAIIDATAAEINAAEDGETQYRLTGYITKVASTTYGNIYIADATDTVYVYGTLDASGASGNWESLGINEGDIITVVGPKTSYKENPQLKNVSVEDVKHVTDISCKDFNALADDKETYYRIKGVASDIKDDDLYGNFNVTDDSGESVYLYGLLKGWGGEKKQFQSLGVANGDTLTVVGYKTSYGTTLEMGGGFLVAKASPVASPDEPDTPTEEETTLSLTNEEICAAMTGSDYSYSEYTISSESGEWTVNASRSSANTYLQCRGKKGSYIKTPEFEKDIASVTLYFSTAKTIYSGNTYAAFPSTWTVSTEDAAYSSDGNVGTADTDGSESVTIEVSEGNKQVYLTLIGTYAYYIDHIDVNF